MPQSYESWRVGGEKAKTAKIERAISQAAGRTFKREVVGKLYPSKIINGVDIGAECNFWAYKVNFNLSADDGELFDKLNKMIDRAYRRGRDPMTYRRFEKSWRVDGLKSA